MIPQQNQEEFYSRFLQKLESSQKWPGKFMFKFILKENSKKIIQLKKIFTNKSAIYSKKNSSKPVTRVISEKRGLFGRKSMTLQKKSTLP